MQKFSSINRRKTRVIKLGSLKIGNPYPIRVQSMTNTKTENKESTLEQIKSLEKEGCEIIRLAIPNQEAANNIPYFTENSQVPLVADIHFDYKLAISSIENGIHGIRINPGNIDSEDHIKILADKATEKDIPIRVGANSGSLPSKFKFKKDSNNKSFKSSDLAKALVDSAIEQCSLLEKFNFNNIKVSLKSSDVITALEANRKFASISDIPLHLGITEAGTQMNSIIKSSIGMGTLLLEGIGDTIRVSTTGDPVTEVKTGIKILENTGYKDPSPEVISCPTCGRTNLDIENFVNYLEKEINHLKKQGNNFIPSKIAVMGCEVNGPGEAKEADLGIAGAKNGLVIFKNGKIIGHYNEKMAYKIFFKELNNLISS